MSDESRNPSENELLIARLVNTLDDIPDTARLYKRDEDHITWQIEVLESLPESLAEGLRQHLKEWEGAGQAVGFVFEALVRADSRLFNHPETAAAVELRQVLKHSKKYHFDDPLLDFREPDVALVNEEGEFSGYAEAKLSLLDTRALRQLSVSGAKATLFASYPSFTRQL